MTPVVFHNLRGYDSHFLIANLGKSAYKQNYVDHNGQMRTKVVGGVSVIANNMERFMSFTWNRFCFIDSAQFLSASLDRLVSATPDDAFIFSSTLDQHQLLKRKGENISRLYTVSCIICFKHDQRERIFYLVLSRRTSVSDAKPLVCMSLGVYPYEYMDSMTRFDETQLPLKVSIFFCYVLLSPSLSPSLPYVRRCIDFIPLFFPQDKVLLSTHRCSHL